MTCRHAKGAPNCTEQYPPPRSTRARKDPSPTPNATDYRIEYIERVGPHVVLKVKYPNCAACSFDGNKVMVFLNVSEVQLVRWRAIDPHFRDPKKSVVGAAEAPPPAARFPASVEGWDDALAYARSKIPSAKR